ncbi:hypothetical protein V1527DRAFT_406435, partial [Lipomyces starkeyi]
LTLFSHGYTFVGKGTTNHGWTEVRNEADVYRVLQNVQGSAVPTFLANIDLELAYFLYRCDITHMLLLSWGGEQANLVKDEFDDELWKEIRRSKHEI